MSSYTTMKCPTSHYPDSGIGALAIEGYYNVTFGHRIPLQYGISVLRHPSGHEWTRVLTGGASVRECSLGDGMHNECFLWVDMRDL